MRLLIDIGHPGHVHLLKNIYFEMQKMGHHIIFTVKDNIDTAIQLLDYYNIKYKTIGNKKDGLIYKVFNQVKYDVILRNIIIKNKIDIGVGTSASLAHASRITRMKSVILDDDDDEVQPLFVKFAHPFSDVLLSPDALKWKRKRKNTIFYPGYHELAYLHPDRFDPDINVLKDAGVEKGEKYFIMRFNVFKAHHDVGVKGISLENKVKLVKLLSNYGKVFITTEREIEPELKQYQFKLHPAKMHSFLYYSTMLIGDSQTMTSEAAVLGVPALKCNSFSGNLSVPNELENKYGLCYSYLPDKFSEMINKIKILLLIPDLKSEWLEKRDIMLKDKIDVSDYLIRFIENYYNGKNKK